MGGRGSKGFIILAILLILVILVLTIVGKINNLFDLSVMVARENRRTQGRPKGASQEIRSKDKREEAEEIDSAGVNFVIPGSGNRLCWSRFSLACE